MLGRGIRKMLGAPSNAPQPRPRVDVPPEEPQAAPGAAETPEAGPGPSEAPGTQQAAPEAQLGGQAAPEGALPPGSGQAAEPPPGGAGGEPPPPGGEMPPAEGGMPPGIEMPEITGGSTRPLPNANYFQNERSREVLEFFEKIQKPRDSVSWQQTSEGAGQVEAERLAALMGQRGTYNINSQLSVDEVVALRNSLDGQAKEIHELATSYRDKIQAGETLSTEETAAMQQLLDRLAATENIVSGELNRAGVLLNAMKIPVGTSDFEVSRALARQARDGGGPEQMAYKVLAIASTDPVNTAAVNNAARGSWGARAWDKVMTIRYNLMLSSVRTHLANIAGSGLTGLYETVAIRGVGAVNQILENAVRTTGLAPGRTLPVAEAWQDSIGALQDWGASMRGAVNGMANGMRLFKAIATGKDVMGDKSLAKLTSGPINDVGKFANESGMRLSPMGSSTVANIGSMPTRLLEAEDAFFRATFYQSKVEELANRAARQAYPNDPQGREAFLRSVLEDGNVPTDIRKEAIEYSQKLTFTNDPSAYGKFLGAFGKSMANLQNVPGMRLLMPFVRTPVNILNYTIEQTPVFGQLTQASKTRQALFGSDQVARSEALARIEIGLGLFAMVGTWVEDGAVTGAGSQDYAMRRVLESKGFRPNAVRIGANEDGTGGKYMELSRLDPLGLLVGQMASVWEMMNELGMNETEDLDITPLLSAMMLSSADLLLDRSYLSTIGDLMDAINLGASGSSGLMRIASATVTSLTTAGIVRDFRELTDEDRREMAFDPTTEGLMQRMLMQTFNGAPIASRGLPNAIDWRGRPFKNAGNMIARAFLPVRLGEIEAMDLATGELLRNGVAPKKPKPILNIEGAGGRVQLNLLDAEFDPSGHLYAEYQAFIGQAREALVLEVAQDPDYRQAVAEGLSGTPNSMAGMAIGNAVGQGKTQGQQEFLEALAAGKFKSRITGETVTVPEHVRVMGENALEDVVEILRLQQQPNLEEFPGYRAGKPGAKNVPPAFRPEF